METKYLYSVHFEESDFQDLDCVFDTYKKAKEAVKDIFSEVSLANPAWQNLVLEEENSTKDKEWAVFRFDYIGEDAKYLKDPNPAITIDRIPFNALPDCI